ncbi:uncharacterized protein [Spinacia oleracea]|uniref:rRNA N-glycosylase n=1 Tax=Spinacia oleracea TaxID=3562 RepID=A0A9R0HZJ7_SPIOL|nr:uncharacterized protein LOC110779855 [Spinacia oleracea]XP_021840012.2 uncharacterized protein LOC110779855 [Spinacia oleracea]XP_056698284.1 uncharacterized protein LOC110779855 [Spinacia oleracea]XP_056698286.1 uncharacterized protein LOC110779855 [Spinacia oleracea]XP_056698289.1 uncharacterized protein LOC110779855 [Spinacia oleracea]XP_056698291.1 uncharacterized protein LOC110779855 [Spinacia oleracea]
MPPKISKDKNKPKAQLKGEVKVGDIFHIEDVQDRDRFLIHLDESDLKLPLKFLSELIMMRYCCAYNGKKCQLLKFRQKLRCAEPIDYKMSDQGLFMILTLVVFGDVQIEFLVFKPRVYILAVGVKGQWWKVTDFTEHTTMDFPGAHSLGYDGNYRTKIPGIFSFSMICDNVMNLFKGIDNGKMIANTEKHFKSLVVVIAESIRFAELLEMFYTVLKYHDRVVELNNIQRWLIRNWETLSSNWVLYDLGYSWKSIRELSIRRDSGDDKSDIPPPRDCFDENHPSKDPTKIFDMLSLILYPQDRYTLGSIESLQKDTMSRVRDVGKVEVDILVNMVTREVLRMIEVAKTEDNANPIAVENSTRKHYEFILNMEKSLLKRLEQHEAAGSSSKG